MATCKERILRQMKAGKQMSIDDIAKTLNHGKSTVKSAILALRKDGLIKIVSYRRTYNSTTPTHVWGWTGKQEPDPRKVVTAGIISSTDRVLAALRRRASMTMTELILETGYSETLTRRATKDLREEGKVRIVGWRAQRGAPVALFGLSNGEPDDVFTKGQFKIERRRKAIEEPQRAVIKPRRDIAAAWF